VTGHDGPRRGRGSSACVAGCSTSSVSARARSWTCGSECEGRYATRRTATRRRSTRTSRAGPGGDGRRRALLVQPTIKPPRYPLEFGAARPTRARASARAPALPRREARASRAVDTDRTFAGEALNDRDAVLAARAAPERPRVVSSRSVAPARSRRSTYSTSLSRVAEPRAAGAHQSSAPGGSSGSVRLATAPRTRRPAAPPGACRGRGRHQHHVVEGAIRQPRLTSARWMACSSAGACAASASVPLRSGRARRRTRRGRPRAARARAGRSARSPRADRPRAGRRASPWRVGPGRHDLLERRAHGGDRPARWPRASAHAECPGGSCARASPRRRATSSVEAPRARRHAARDRLAGSRAGRLETVGACVAAGPGRDWCASRR